MFCGSCGQQMTDQEKFCPVCGTSTSLGTAAKEIAAANTVPIQELLKSNDMSYTDYKGKVESNHIDSQQVQSKINKIHEDDEVYLPKDQKKKINKKVLGVVVLVLVLLLPVAVYGIIKVNTLKQTAQTRDIAKETETPLNDWAVKVNGDSILIKDYDARVAASQITYEKQGVKFDTDQGKAAIPEIKSQLLDRMIEGKLTAQEVKNLKLNPEDVAVKAQEDIIKKNIGDAMKFQDTLNKQGTTEPELMNFLTVYEKVTADVKMPSDSDVKAFYDKNTSKYASDYAEVKSQVKQDALNVAKDAKFQTYFDDLHKKAKIEYAKGYEPAS